MKIQKKLSIIFALLMAALSLYICAFFYERTMRSHYDDLRRTLVELAISASMLVDADMHTRVYLSRDMNSPEYHQLRNRLNKFYKNIPRLKYIYTMVKSDKPDIWKFVIDASDPKDEDGDGKISALEDTAPIGQEYDVSEFEEMKLAFDGPIVDKEISVDQWGAFLSGYAPIYDSQGNAVAIVGLDISADTILKEQRTLQIRIAVIFLSAIFLTLFISNAVSKGLTRPLLKLVEGVRIIGQGNFSHKIEVKTKDEIDLLASAINDMGENINDKLRKLQILNNVSQSLSSSIELNAALKTSLNIVFELTGTSVGLILLADNNESRVELAIAEGVQKPKFVDDDAFIGHKKFNTRLSDDFREWIRHPGNNKIHFKDDLKNIPQAALALEWLDATGCDFFVPLIFKNSIRGFFLYSGKLHGSVDFLNTLFYQITMAIENARLYHSAITDGLTGLYIYRYFQTQLEQEFQRARRYGRFFSLLMIDIDHFKKFNDTYGHQTGDIVLKEVSKILKYQTREVDIVARYGGEELAVILPETDTEGALKVAEKIRSTVERYRFPQDLKVTVSIGLASCDSKGPVNKEALIKQADNALYRAKQEGRNRVIVA